MSGNHRQHLLPTSSIHGDDLSPNQMEYVDEPTQNESALLPRKSSDAASSMSLSQSIPFQHPPDPADAATRKSVLKTVAGYILVTEFCERLAYYGFAGSLVLFFQTQLNYSNAEADVQYSAWSGVCYVTPLLGGYIADSYLGRYRAILIFCLIYLGGLVLVVFGSIPDEVTPAVFFPAIYIVALGTGGIKPNVSTMGADQFDDRYSQDRKEKESFFNWFYWSINLGSLISYTLVAYICQYGLPFLGGEKWGFFVGYTIPAIMMGLAILIFFMGTNKYRMQPLKGSVLAESVRIAYEALWKRRGEDTGTGSRLDRAKKSCGGSFNDKHVDGVKLVARITPFLLVMIPYWGIYSQMSTAFQNQACQMDLDIGSISVPVSALNCFDTLSILLLVPVFDGYIYPYFKEQGYPMTMLRKIGCGFALACLGMIVAGGVEAARLAYAPTPGNYYDESARDNITPCQSLDDYNPYQYQAWYAGVDDTDEPAHCQQICNTTYTPAGSTLTYLNLTCISCDDIPQMSRLSVFWQIFQFMIIGTSEILASITSLEFFYSQAPTVMRSVSQSLNLATTALGSFMVIPLLYMVNANPNDEWVPLNLDDGHLDYYFFLLAGLMLLTLIFLYYLSLDYEYKQPHELRLLEDDDETRDEASEDGEGEREGSERSGRDGGAKRLSERGEVGQGRSSAENRGGDGLGNPLLSVLEMRDSITEPSSRAPAELDAYHSPFHDSTDQDADVNSLRPSLTHRSSHRDGRGAPKDASLHIHEA